MKLMKVEGDLKNTEESLKTASTKMSRHTMKSTQDEEKINSLSVVLKDQESTIEALRTQLQHMRDRNLELSIRGEEGQKSAGILAANKAAALQQKLDNKSTLLEKASNELKSLSMKHKTVRIQLEKSQRNFAEQLDAKDKDFDLRFAKAKEIFDKEKEEMKEALTLLHEKKLKEKMLQLNNDIAKSNLENDDLRKCTARQRGELDKYIAEIQNLKDLLSKKSGEANEAIQAEKRQTEKLLQELKAERTSIEESRILLENEMQAFRSKEESFVADKKEIESLKLRLRDRQKSADQRAEALKKKTQELQEVERLYHSRRK